MALEAFVPERKHKRPAGRHTTRKTTLRTFTFGLPASEPQEVTATDRDNENNPDVFIPERKHKRPAGRPTTRKTTIRPFTFGLPASEPQEIKVSDQNKENDLRSGLKRRPSDQLPNEDDHVTPVKKPKSTTEADSTASRTYLEAYLSHLQKDAKERNESEANPSKAFAEFGDVGSVTTIQAENADSEAVSNVVTTNHTSKNLPLSPRRDTPIKFTNKSPGKNSVDMHVTSGNVLIPVGNDVSLKTPSKSPINQLSSASKLPSSSTRKGASSPAINKQSSASDSLISPLKAPTSGLSISAKLRSLRITEDQVVNEPSNSSQHLSTELSTPSNVKQRKIMPQKLTESPANTLQSSTKELSKSNSPSHLSTELSTPTNAKRRKIMSQKLTESPANMLQNSAKELTSNDVSLKSQSKLTKSHDSSSPKLLSTKASKNHGDENKPENSSVDLFAEVSTPSTNLRGKMASKITELPTRQLRKSASESSIKQLSQSSKNKSTSLLCPPIGLKATKDPVLSSTPSTSDLHKTRTKPKSPLANQSESTVPTVDKPEEVVVSNQSRRLSNRRSGLFFPNTPVGTPSSQSTALSTSSKTSLPRLSIQKSLRKQAGKSSGEPKNVSNELSNIRSLKELAKNVDSVTPNKALKTTADTKGKPATATSELSIRSSPRLASKSVSNLPIDSEMSVHAKPTKTVSPEDFYRKIISGSGGTVSSKTIPIHSSIIPLFLSSKNNKPSYYISPIKSLQATPTSLPTKPTTINKPPMISKATLTETHTKKSPVVLTEQSKVTSPNKRASRSPIASPSRMQSQQRSTTKEADLENKTPPRSPRVSNTNLRVIDEALVSTKRLDKRLSRSSLTTSPKRSSRKLEFNMVSGEKKSALGSSSNNEIPTPGSIHGSTPASVTSLGKRQSVKFTSTPKIPDLQGPTKKKNIAQHFKDIENSFSSLPEHDLSNRKSNHDLEKDDEEEPILGTTSSVLNRDGNKEISNQSFVDSENKKEKNTSPRRRSLKNVKPSVKGVRVPKDVLLISKTKNRGKNVVEGKDATQSGSDEWETYEPESTVTQEKGGNEDVEEEKWEVEQEQASHVLESLPEIEISDSEDSFTAMQEVIEFQATLRVSTKGKWPLSRENYRKKTQPKPKPAPRRVRYWNGPAKNPRPGKPLDLDVFATVLEDAIEEMKDNVSESEYDFLLRYQTEVERHLHIDINNVEYFIALNKEIKKLKNQIATMYSENSDLEVL